MSRSGATFGFAVALLSGRPSYGGESYALGAALVAYCEYSAHTRLVWSVGRSVVSARSRSVELSIYITSRSARWAARQPARHARAIGRLIAIPAFVNQCTCSLDFTARLRL